MDMFGHGRLAVAISMTVQPTLHTSARRPCPVCLMTSGAIHGTDPAVAARVVLLVRFFERLEVCRDLWRGRPLILPVEVTLRYAHDVNAAAHFLDGDYGR